MNSVLWAHLPYLNLFTLVLHIHTFFTPLGSLVFWLLHHRIKQSSCHNVHGQQPCHNSHSGCPLTLYTTFCISWMINSFLAGTALEHCGSACLLLVQEGSSIEACLGLWCLKVCGPPCRSVLVHPGTLCKNLGGTAVTFLAHKQIV